MRREEQDKKLADKGWQSMQQTLDREMPVERKRRPVVWWWLGMLMLPLAIWGSQAWWNTQNIPPTPSTPATSIRPSRPVVQSEHQQAATDNNKQVVEASATTPVTYGKNPGRQKQRNASMAQQNAKARSLPSVVIPDAPAISAGYKNSDLAENVVLPVPAHNATTVHATVFTMDRLPQADMSLQQENETLQLTQFSETIIPVEKTQKDKRNNKWAFGITAAASTETFSSLNGLSAGLSADWQFARKWGIRASALYTRYRPSTNSQPVVAVEEYSYVNATGLYTGASGLGAPTTPYVNESLAEGYVYIPLRKLHQVEMPVMLWWQPVRPLRLYSGLAVDYTFMGQSAQQNYSNNQVLSLASDLTQKRASQVATSELPRWQMQYQGGLGFQLGKHADVGLFWHVPIHADFSARKDLASYNSVTSQLDVLATPSSTLLPSLGRFVLQGTWKF